MDKLILIVEDDPRNLTLFRDLLQKFGYTIIEADGAAMKPLKAPDTSFEPIIPRNTTLVIPVVRIDALGKPLSEENVFRAEIAAELSGRSLGDPVTEDTIVNLIVHPLGMTYGSPDSSRIIPFINKVDLDRGLTKARRLSSNIPRIACCASSAKLTVHNMPYMCHQQSSCRQ